MHNHSAFTATLLSVLSLLTACAGRKTPADAPTNLTPERAAIHFLQPMFDILDCEAVGRIEAGEVDEHFYHLFTFRDSDHSRSLSLDEYLASRAHPRPQLDTFTFQQMDSNTDQQVSASEFRLYVYRAVDLIDSDNDGEVTEQEAQMNLWRKGVAHGK